MGLMNKRATTATRTSSIERRRAHEAAVSLLTLLPTAPLGKPLERGDSFLGLLA